MKATFPPTVLHDVHYPHIKALATRRQATDREAREHLQLGRAVRNPDPSLHFMYRWSFQLV